MHIKRFCLHIQSLDNKFEAHHSRFALPTATAFGFDSTSGDQHVTGSTIAIDNQIFQPSVVHQYS
jgi:hypothetical protein